jgi:hypothetical protein
MSISMVKSKQSKLYELFAFENLKIRIQNIAQGYFL